MAQTGAQPSLLSDESGQQGVDPAAGVISKRLSRSYWPFLLALVPSYWRICVCLHHGFNPFLLFPSLKPRVVYRGHINIEIPLGDDLPLLKGYNWEGIGFLKRFHVYSQ